jgi:anaerobic sulfite reductase subunit A
MGFQVNGDGLNRLLDVMAGDYLIYAPQRYTGGGTFSDVDCIRYGQVTDASQIVFDEKSDYSMKEVLLPIAETLFYFTEDMTKEGDMPRKKGAVVFLRSCDLHGIKRLDEIYLNNGAKDYYYERLRENVKFVLMGCSTSFEHCFCVSMGTNQASDYDVSVNWDGEFYYVNCREDGWADVLREHSFNEFELEPVYVTENDKSVKIPENLNAKVGQSGMWREYDGRCIACGRCNFVCPTCTCFTMQDIFYKDNEKAGERRRVHASCMVDGYTDVAGGGSYRQKNGDRMRFKVLHKVHDFKERNGYHMCVGCGRCDDVCPEYISFSDCINRLGEGMKEVEQS